MGKVVASASMSLDGYIAKADNTIGHLFDWFDNGDIECRTINPDITFHLNQDELRLLAGLGVDDRRARVRSDAVRLHRRVGRSPHDGRAGGRGDARAAGGLDRRAPGCVARVRDRRRRGGGGSERRRSPAIGPWLWPRARSPVSAWSSVCSTRSRSTSCRWSSAVAARSSGSSRPATSRSAIPRPASRRSGSSTSCTRCNAPEPRRRRRCRRALWLHATRREDAVAFEEASPLQILIRSGSRAGMRRPPGVMGVPPQRSGALISLGTASESRALCARRSVRMRRGLVRGC